ncbi:hypothetical protein DSL72_001080 [Monilinia vaccinii-corymbosi]|uniref:Phosphoribulokinase/uridine kinase domain-containing protein n=1 Tax=Monilinia vaccinii-corymbosi TaxID=61207 RepID=A0A8A3P128_9HELO|nr:hypothetical protein DSL72_001080 [Monilinia vaccinii-corymbosi]
MIDPRKAVVLGISGCSSSGKTTLSRMLCDIFPNTFILHEDDCYRPEEELPKKHGMVDWDCAEALDIPKMAKSLEHIRREGTLPPNFDSKEDQNSLGECPVPDAEIEALRSQVTAWTQPGQPGHGLLSDSKSSIRLCIFEGFLLYSKSLASIQAQIDLKLFLRVSFARAKGRREARSGYVTLEGFWEDPPGYFDKIVWSNYVEDHEWMFEDGDVEGQIKRDVANDLNLKCQDGGLDIDMTTTLKWAVATIMESLPSFVRNA